MNWLRRVRNPPQVASMAEAQKAGGSPLGKPVEIGRPGTPGYAALMIDRCFLHDEKLVVAGWRVGEVAINLETRSGGQSKQLNFLRSDVALHFGIDEESELGFAYVLPAQEDSVFIWKGCDGKPHSVGLEPSLSWNPESGSPVDAQLCHFIAGGEGPVQVVPPPSAREIKSVGFLEGAVWVPDLSKMLITGWAVPDIGESLWLEDDLGKRYPLEPAVIRKRPDVLASLGASYGEEALRSGFIIQHDIYGAPEIIKLCARGPVGRGVLATVSVRQLAANPVDVAQWLFGIPSTMAEAEPRFEKLEQPLLASMIEARSAAAEAVEADVVIYGESRAKPLVSIIIPLYKRYDFVEEQMLQWSRDAWIREHCELVYVLDDPPLATAVGEHFRSLHELYEIPSKLVLGPLNRGFSGANNLGVTHAVADLLLFLNSDVFPTAPGWLQQLVSVLDADVQAAAVGPRLLYPEGGIQHAGMAFERNSQFGVWVNRHPAQGLPASMDPHTQVSEVPAVTGACLLARRPAFESVGGWDTGYLVGDFEDSDLCLKLRESGYGVLYHPGVELVHLERQSMTALGDGGFRQQVVLWNARRHQKRWANVMEAANYG